MDSVCNYGCNCVLALLQHHQKMLFSLSVIHANYELVEQLGYSLRMDILEATVEHEIDEVIDYLAVLAEVKESL